MNTWTAHIAPGRAPVLVAEGFAWGGLVLGPVWLAGCGAWTMAGLVLAADGALAMLAPGWTLLPAAFATGLFGHDLRRVSLGWSGYTLDHVIAASHADGAFARLLARRPDLASAALR